MPAQVLSVNVQDNPLVSNTGTPTADAVVITTNENANATVTYEIAKRDGSDSFRVSSIQSIANYPQIIAMSGTQLTIRLRERTKYKVRVSAQGVTSAWYNFKTRDKTFKSPGAVTQLSDDTDDTVHIKNNRRIVVTNSAKATTVQDGGGNVVINNSGDFGNGTTAIEYTARGATVRTQSF